MDVRRSVGPSAHRDTASIVSPEFVEFVFVFHARETFIYTLRSVGATRRRSNL